MVKRGFYIGKEANFPSRGSWGFCPSLVSWLVVWGDEEKFADSVGSFIV